MLPHHNTIPISIRLYQQLTDLLEIKTGQNVLDLGCGTGAALCFLLDHAGTTGQVSGIDINKELLAIAKQTYQKAITTKQLSLIASDATTPLPFANNYFDRIFCHNLLECIPNRIALLNDCFHIMKPGGQLLMSHFDFDTTVFNSRYKDLTRKLAHTYADATQSWQTVSDGQLGRKLRGLFTASKFKNFSVHTIAFDELDYTQANYGYQFSNDIVQIARKNRDFNFQELQDWLNDLEELARCGAYYFTINLVYVLATK